jgi:hypothetical protein
MHRVQAGVGDEKELTVKHLEAQNETLEAQKGHYWENTDSSSFGVITMPQGCSKEKESALKVKVDDTDDRQKRTQRAMRFWTGRQHPHQTFKLNEMAYYAMGLHNPRTRPAGVAPVDSQSRDPRQLG